MVLDRSVDFEIGGKKYELVYTNKAMAKCEKSITSQNAFKTFLNYGSGEYPSFQDMHTIFKCALMGGNPSMTDQEAEELCEQAYYEQTLMIAFNAGLEAMKKAGFIRVKNIQAAEPEA